MTRVIVFTAQAAVVAFLSANVGFPQAASKTSHLKSSVSTSSKTASSRKAAARKTTASHLVPVSSTTVHSGVKAHGARGRKGRGARKAPAPSYQLHPDTERYVQIQQALADRGYYKGQVNGEWSDDSVDALKRFQADQKLDNDGKINALTLTGLGLGPKHDGSTASTVPLSAANTSSATPGSPPDPAAVQAPAELPAETTPPQSKKLN